MDGESPAWLEEGKSSSAAPAPASASALAAPSPLSADFDDGAAPPTSTSTSAGAAAAARTGGDSGNVAGTFLSGMNPARLGKKAAAGVVPPATTTTNATSTRQILAGEAELPKLILFMRVLNMGTAALLITTSIIQLVGLPPISIWVTAIYATCGGLLICCLETQLKIFRTIIAMNFGFLFHSIYRMLFYALMASVCWSYQTILGKATSIVLGCVAVFNTFVLCKYPGYRKMREDIAAEEDARIQAKIHAQVRKQAISSMGWGK